MHPIRLPLTFVVFLSVLLAAGCHRRAERPRETVAEQPSTVETLPELTSSGLKSRRAEEQQSLDPQHDGWPSEAFAQAAEAQLMRLLGFLANDDLPTEAEIAPLVTDDFACAGLRPEKLQRTYHDDVLTVERATEQATDRSKPWRGPQGLVHALRQLAAPMSQPGARRANVKTVQVRLETTTAATTHVIETFGWSATGLVEQHAVWQCQWSTQPDATPRLRAIRADSFEEVTSARRDPLFRDATAAVLGQVPAYRQQLSWGLNQWLSRIETIHGMYVFAEYGIAVGDVNGDGLDDVYVCQPGGLPNRLLLHAADGTVTDHSAAAGVDWLDHTSSALLVDLDNDGDQDLALAIENRRVLVMQNDGQAHFDLAAELPIDDRHVQGLSSVDYDSDGDLDLYLTVGFADQRARTDETPPEFVYHDANEGGANVLFRNELAGGRLAFTDVTRQVGLDVNNRRHSLAAAWEDYDNDGDQDLYVANDYGQNCLYRNQGGRFTEVATEANVVDFGSGMSVSWSDFDRDGDMDLYVGNMFSSAGSRITGQRAFQPRAATATRELLSRFAKGNTLFRNDGKGGFEDVGAAAGVERGRWAWSSLFADLNNDGWDDLFVSNGYITNDQPDDL